MTCCTQGNELLALTCLAAAAAAAAVLLLQGLFHLPTPSSVPAAGAVWLGGAWGAVALCAGWC
jgi:hypothetical protein